MSVAIKGRGLVKYSDALERYRGTIREKDRDIMVLEETVREKDALILKLTGAFDALERALPMAEVGVALIEKGDAEQRETIAQLEEALREKDDIIQSQYAELQSTRRRLDQAVDMLNHMQAEMRGKTPV